MLKVVAEETARTELSSSVDEICREGARRMLAAALETEVDAYVEALADQLDRVCRGHVDRRHQPGAAGG